MHCASRKYTRRCRQKHSNNGFVLAVVLAELAGGNSFSLLEDAVEVGHIVESAIVTDFRNRVGRVDQCPGGCSQTYVGQEIDETFGCVLLHKAAERRLAHVHHVCYIR